MGQVKEALDRDKLLLVRLGSWGKYPEAEKTGGLKVQEGAGLQSSGQHCGGP